MAIVLACGVSADEAKIGEASVKVSFESADVKQMNGSRNECEFL